MNDITVQYYLDLLRNETDKKKIRKIVRELEREISDYRLTAWKYAPFTNVARICHREANRIEKQMQKALGK